LRRARNRAEILLTEVESRFAGEGGIGLSGNRVGKSGGVADVLTAYYAHRDAAGFALREAGNKQTETI
jgi:hypothetical protein